MIAQPGNRGQSPGIGSATLAAPPTTEPTLARRQPPSVVQRLLREPTAVFGLIIFLLLAGMALAAPAIAPHDPLTGRLIDRLRPPFWLENAAPGKYLGADQLGRDVLSRIIYGARVSLLVGLTSVAFASLIGLALGLIAGYFGGHIDNVIMRLVDVQMAFPFILLALAIVAVVGPGIVNLIIVFSVTGWVFYARTIRGSVLAVREREFVQAARAVGASDWRLVARHIFPNVVNPLVVIASFELAKVIIYEASLSFLGIGVPPPTPSWGSMLADGREYVQTAWWLGALPGLALMATVLGVNFVGDALRDALDPGLRNV